MRGWALLLVLLGAACNNRMVYRDGDVMVVKPLRKALAGERVALHPAVIELVLASPESPLRKYHDLQAQRQGGASGEARAREQARTLAPHINKGLLRGAPVGEVDVVCCKRPTVAGDRFVAGKVGIGLIANKSALVVRIDTRLDGQLSWDLQRVPGAFDPDASLTYEQAARLARPLHGREPLW